MHERSWFHEAHEELCVLNVLDNLNEMGVATYTSIIIIIM